MTLLFLTASTLKNWKKVINKHNTSRDAVIPGSVFFIIQIEF